MRIVLEKRLNGEWRFVPNQKIIGCCHKFGNFMVDEHGNCYSAYDGSGEGFKLDVDKETGVIQYRADDPYYFLSGIIVCPYCGTALSISREYLTRLEKEA